MHPDVRTTPRCRTARRPAAALLAAVVLALLAVLGAAGPSPAAPLHQPAVTAASAADHHRPARPHADDGCEPDCGVRAATRKDSPAEHPAPRGPFTARGKETALPAPGRARAPAPAARLPIPDPHAPRADRGRAPPTHSGT
ncbi:hypothetical protein [Streptomyces indicus]|uniref:Uncharacterized protein n=1 Tax=Streptomyces indicus TaxID=417292 RepID=A0A1G9DF19_9ACTN|nr:hypothetical protein [Streptomyces indicus]SDK62437.1 hypothetical protein SAMN05421806_109190 [Streptomyces indicus]